MQRAQFRDGFAVTSHGERLTSGDPVENIPSVVPQLPDRHFVHGQIVSPVRHAVEERPHAPSAVERRRTLATAPPSGRIDLSKANTFEATSAQGVEITGNLWGGGTVSTTLGLSGFAFTTFAFDSSWNNPSSVVLNGIGSACCGPVPGNYYAVDNIVVTVAAPEPGTFSLLGLGSAYVVGRRRRSRRKGEDRQIEGCSK